MIWWAAKQKNVGWLWHLVDRLLGNAGNGAVGRLDTFIGLDSSVVPDYCMG